MGLCHIFWNRLSFDMVLDRIKACPADNMFNAAEFFLRLEPRDEPLCRSLMQGLKLHLSQLEEQYPEYVNVSYMEI